MCIRDSHNFVESEDLETLNETKRLCDQSAVDNKAEIEKCHNEIIEVNNKDSLIETEIQLIKKKIDQLYQRTSGSATVSSVLKQNNIQQMPSPSDNETPEYIESRIRNIENMLGTYPEIENQVSELSVNFPVVTKSLEKRLDSLQLSVETMPLIGTPTEKPPERAGPSNTASAYQNIISKQISVKKEDLDSGRLTAQDLVNMIKEPVLEQPKMPEPPKMIDLDDISPSPSSQSLKIDAQEPVAVSYTHLTLPTTERV